MEENNDIFLAGGDALVYLAGPMHKKNIPQHLFGAIHLVRTYLMTNFSITSPSCTDKYAFRVIPLFRVWFHQFDFFVSHFDFAGLS